MTKHLGNALLQKHADGELPTGERWRVEAHLGGCPECRSRYDAYVALLERLGTLGSSIEPPMDLWPGIAGRIGSGGRTPLGTVRERSGGRRGYRSVVAWITAAAAVLVLGIGLGRMLPRSASPSLSVAPASDAEVPSTLVDFDRTGATYDEAVEDLLTVLAERRNELRPETVATIEENLRIIDAAIAEARAALEADPANESLQRHLSSYMRTKLAVLQMVTGAVGAGI